MDALQELTELRQWMLWRYEKGTKVPYTTGGWAGKSNDPGCWATYEQCRESHAPRNGIAFVFSADDPYCGIDLDDCIIDGVYTPEAIEIIERFRGVAYCEVSPSGTGVKLTTRAKKPAGSRCQNGWIECYDHLRFWTWTNDCVGDGFREIGDGQAAVGWLIEKHLKAPPPKPRRDPVTTGPAPKGMLQRALAYADGALPAGEGGRNNALFRLAGHLAAFVDSDGAKLSETDILELACEWNSRLAAPLDDREVGRTVRSAMTNGTAREEKPPEVIEREQLDILDIDWDALNSKVEDETEELDDEAFCWNLVPEYGLLRAIFDFYGQVAYRRSVVMGLACAVSLVQTILGRRVRSHTDLRTNDYNLILATTGSGKEACESTITKILESVAVGDNFLIPADIQSGNGLMKAVAGRPCGIWVCDEFGKILQAVLDKKGNQHTKNIGTHLLKLYGKSAGTYSGAAHSDGIRNRVVQPHLCVLGLSTSSTVFEAVATEQVSDGLIGRIAFWPVQDRPEPRDFMEIVEVSQSLSDCVKSWLTWEPGKTDLVPDPQTIRMSDEASERWRLHAWQINDKMKSESELRAAIWSRVAARTMKLAMVHRCARLEVEPATCQWDFVNVEILDVQWAVCLSNWLARISCGLIKENVYDKSGGKAKQILSKALESNAEVAKRDILRTFRSLTAGDLQAAADELGLDTVEVTTKGRPKIIYRKRVQA